MDCVAVTPTPEDLERNLPQPLASQLTVKPLEAHLRSTIGELLDLPQQPLVGGELMLELLHDCSMRLDPALKLRDTLDE